MYEQWTPTMSRRERERLELQAKKRLRQLMFCGGFFLLVFSDVFSHFEGGFQEMPDTMQSVLQVFDSAAEETEYIVTEVGSFFQNLMNKMPEDMVVNYSNEKELMLEEQMVETQIYEDKVVEEFYNETLAIFASPSWNISAHLWSDLMENIDNQDDIVEKMEEKVILAEETHQQFPIGTVLQSTECDLPETHTTDILYLGERIIVTPVYDVITSKFGMREHPLTLEQTVHNGVDIRGNEGTEIFAWSEGVVETVGYTGVVGYYVILNHGDDITTFYAHCSEILVEKGEEVMAGDPIALVGATGEVTAAHLHFEIKWNNTYLNPLDYMEWVEILD